MTAEKTSHNEPPVQTNGQTKETKRQTDRTHPPAEPGRSHCRSCLRSSRHTQPGSRTKMRPRGRARTRSWAYAWWCQTLERTLRRVWQRQVRVYACITQFSSCSLSALPPFSSTLCDALCTEPTVAGPEFIAREEGGSLRRVGRRWWWCGGVSGGRVSNASVEVACQVRNEWRNGGNMGGSGAERESYSWRKAGQERMKIEGIKKKRRNDDPTKNC